MRRMKVGVLGALNIDIIIHGSAPHGFQELRNWVGPSEIVCLTAGSVGYFSQNFAKLDCEVHLVSTIADDPCGDLILSSLHNANLSTDHITIEPNAESGIGVYMLLYDAPKRPMTYQLPTHHAWSPSLTVDTIKYLLDTNLLHCGGYLHFPDLWNQDVPHLFSQAKKKGLITSLDPQFPLQPLDSAWTKVLKPLLPYTDILFLDESEALGVTGKEDFEQAVESLKGIGVSQVVIKLGKKGCLLLREGKETRQPAIKPDKFVDSIGAGDAFDVGFLYGALKGFKPEESLRLAVLVASKSTEGSGGTKSFPYIRELSNIDEEEN